MKVYITIILSLLIMTCELNRYNLKRWHLLRDGKFQNTPNRIGFALEVIGIIIAIIFLWKL